MPDGNGQPTMSEIQRRVQRVEALLDERIVTRDMLAASEKLAEAREVNHNASVQTLEKRVDILERRSDRNTQLMIGAFLALLVQAIVLILTVATRGT
jgi:hypothetical protein